MECVVFDLDGTLVDAFDAVAASVNHALAQLALPVQAPDVIRQTVGRGERHLLATFAGEQRVEAALELYRQHHPEALKEHACLLPDVADVLRSLSRAGVVMGVASNRSSRFTLLALEVTGIRSYFSALTCADQVAAPKPAPDMLLNVMQTLTSPADRTVYVGDMPLDMETARAAGVRVVAVATGVATRAELEAAAPDAVLGGIGELPGWLQDSKRADSDAGTRKNQVFY